MHISRAAHTTLIRAVRSAVVAAACILAVAAGPLPLLAQSPQQSTFKSAGEAVEALVAAVKADGTSALLAVLGHDADEIVDSGDPVADKAIRERFLTAYEQAHELVSAGEGKSTLVIGTEKFPFPIPIVAENGAWRFDTEAGADEILTRRIGENENNTMLAMLAFAVAQDDYAAADRDGKGPQYARRLMSSPGKKDGLYWPASAGEQESPLGPLIAEAQAAGYKAGRGGAETSQPFNGYVFKMLYGQSNAAPDGARDYIVNDRMIGGYALIAAPASYGNSGVMTFMISHAGVLYQKDLGPDSRRIASGMKIFDPDDSWEIVLLDPLLVE
ncbi:MAG: DUF2950 domain-containing protein [Pseudomonadota bacterium]